MTFHSGDMVMNPHFFSNSDPFIAHIDIQLSGLGIMVMTLRRRLDAHDIHIEDFMDQLNAIQEKQFFLLTERKTRLDNLK